MQMRANSAVHASPHTCTQARADTHVRTRTPTHACRLQKVQEEKEQQMLRTQRRLQALNESLVQASQGNSTGRSARKYLAPK